LDQNLITIVIPTYNRAQHIASAIQSVIDQSSGAWELIIVDDGSDDDTFDYLTPYLEDERINYIYQEHTGVSAARNRGAHNATGDFLIFLDSDDVFLPGLVKFLHEAKFFRFDMICWQVVKVIDGKKSLWKPSALGKIYNNIKASFLAGSVCYRKEVFLSSGGYDVNIKFGENYELGMRVSDFKTLRTKIIDRPFLRNNVNTQNRTSNSLSNRLDSYIYMYEKHRQKYEQDKKAKSEMNYLLGYVLEKSEKPAEAQKFYRTSWVTTPWNYKAFLKILYLQLIS
jgi:glycosyltransferase involved in cell wall biosynthesis